MEVIALRTGLDPRPSTLDPPTLDPRRSDLLAIHANVASGHAHAHALDHSRAQASDDARAIDRYTDSRLRAVDVHRAPVRVLERRTGGLPAEDLEARMGLQNLGGGSPTHRSAGRGPRNVRLLDAIGFNRRGAQQAGGS